MGLEVGAPVGSPAALSIPSLCLMDMMACQYHSRMSNQKWVTSKMHCLPVLIQRVLLLLDCSVSPAD